MASQKALEFSFSAAVINKVLKDAGVPENTCVSKDARSALGKSASIFVLYLTTQAKVVAGEDDRKTISPQDILAAADILGFGDFLDELKETSQQSKLLNDENRRKRAEKQRMRAMSNPASLLDHSQAFQSPDSLTEVTSQEAGDDDPDIIQVDDDDE